MDCNFCGKNFYHKSNLIRHQTTSKKCIQIQKNNNNDNIIIKLFNCEFCDKELSSKQSLTRHLNTCKKKIVNEIKTDYKKDNDEITELKNIVTKLQEEIKEIKETKNTPITINNNSNNNIVNNNSNNIVNNITINNIDFMSYMTSEKIKEVFDKYYNIQILLGSKESLAHFTIDNFLSGSDKPIYLCSDKQRNKFYFLDKNNKKIDDSNAQILINLIINHGLGSIKNTYTKYTKIVKQKQNKLDIALNDIMNLKIDNKEYINELTTYLPRTIEERKILDETKSIENKFEEQDGEDGEEEEDEEKNETIIAGFPISELYKYKIHYMDTGKITAPADFIKSKENIILYTKFLNS
jgi:hypothetical protein